MAKGGLSKANAIRQPKLLVVEGNHERDFFESWLITLGITNIQFMPIGGKTLLRDNLAGLVKQKPFLDGNVSSIVIVRDADDNPAGAFTSVRDAVQDIGLPVPSRSFEMISENDLLVAIAIVPAEDKLGALEELLIETVGEDPIIPLAFSFIDNAVAVLHTSHYRDPPPLHRLGKAKAHAFLSTFVNPDKDPGKAALAGVRQYSHTALDPLLSILRNM
jgi:hypothetical protein